MAGNTSQRLYHLARQADNSRLLIAAACRMADHAAACLIEGQIEPLPASLAVSQIVQGWLDDKARDAGHEAVAQVALPARRISGNLEIPLSVWAHCLSCSHLARMLQEHIDGPDDKLLAKRLGWIATEACNCVASQIAQGDTGSPSYSLAWDAEGEWQVECLESILGLCELAPGGDRCRLRNSLLAGK
jgi:hypothetical protein